MREGVSMTDPARTYVDATVELEPDVRLLPGTVLEGRTVVGSGSEIGPDCRLVDTVVGEDAVIVQSVARESEIGDRVTVGPFASLRPGTRVAADAHLGTFVETKNADIGEGAKVPHLAYIGDATIGARANIGAGTITANYDGREKHRTVVGPDARIGSNTVHRARRAGGGRGGRVHGRRRGREPRRPAVRAGEGGAGADRRGLGRAPGRRGGGGDVVDHMELTPTKRLMLFAGRGNEELSAEVAKCLDVPLGHVVLSTFANGELYCRYGESVRGADLFVFQSHCPPINDRIIEQLIMIDAAKRASASGSPRSAPSTGTRGRTARPRVASRSRRGSSPTCSPRPGSTAW
jgi:serine acetyltransferase